MARYKPVMRAGIFLPVILADQIQSGTFEFALDHLVDHELDCSALDARFNNDDSGASAYDPRVMLKLVLLAYSRGLITSRKIEQACAHNVLFIAISGDSQPGYSHIAKFVRELGDEVQALFTQVRMTCVSPGADRQDHVRHRRREAAGQRQQGAQRHPRRAAPTGPTPGLPTTACSGETSASPLWSRCLPTSATTSA